MGIHYDTIDSKNTYVFSLYMYLKQKKMFYWDYTMEKSLVLHFLTVMQLSIYISTSPLGVIDGIRLLKKSNFPPAISEYYGLNTLQQTKEFL